MKIMTKKAIPSNYGTAAPAYAKVYAAKKGGAAKPAQSYIKFVAACRKSGKSMAECAKLWKAQKGKAAPKTNRRRAARVVRRKGKTKLPAGYGYGA